MINQIMTEWNTRNKPADSSKKIMSAKGSDALRYFVVGRDETGWWTISVRPVHSYQKMYKVFYKRETKSVPMVHPEIL